MTMLPVAYVTPVTYLLVAQYVKAYCIKPY